MNDTSPPTDPPLVRLRELSKHFPVRKGVLSKTVAVLKAVDGVSFDIARGETLGLVGESGCGKTTLGRSLLRLMEPTAGQILFDGVDILGANKKHLRQLRQRMQIIFQDPYASLNPRLTVANLVGESIRAHGLARGAQYDQRLNELLEIVGLSKRYLNRYPHEFSGGQRQRIGIARALALQPDFIVCDEAVSALDVSIQAQIINLLRSLQRDLGLTYLFISHDLNVVRHLAHRIAVMYLGKLVEVGPTEAIFNAPRHPYTRALIGANPVPDPDSKVGLSILEGDVPSPLDPPTGCAFHPRCPRVMPHCKVQMPAMTVDSSASVQHRVWCHLHGSEKT